MPHYENRSSRKYEPGIETMIDNMDSGLFIKKTTYSVVIPAESPMLVYGQSVLLSLIVALNASNTPTRLVMYYNHGNRINPAVSILRPWWSGGRKFSRWSFTGIAMVSGGDIDGEFMWLFVRNRFVTDNAFEIAEIVKGDNFRLELESSSQNNDWLPLLSDITSFVDEWLSPQILS